MKVKTKLKLISTLEVNTTHRINQLSDGRESNKDQQKLSAGQKRPLRCCSE